MSSQQTSDGIFRIPTWLGDNLPSFGYFRIIASTTSLQKARRGRDSSPSSLLIRCINHTSWRTTSIIQANRNHQRFFHSDTNPVFGHVLVHSVDKTDVLIVIVELIWLLFLNRVFFKPPTNRPPTNRPPNNEKFEDQKNVNFVFYINHDFEK